MTKEEFLKRFQEEKLEIGEYTLKLDKISNAPFIIGCDFDEEKWKILPN